MKILFISHYSDLYGANRSLLALLDGLNKDSITPFVLIPRSGDMKKALNERNIACFVFPFKKWMAKSKFKMPLRFLMNVIAVVVLLWKLKIWKIDLIYTNSSLTPIGAWAAHLSKMPHIWHIREFGWEDYGIKHDFGEKIFNYWLDQSAKIIAVSNSVRDRVLNKMKDKVIVIYNGVITKDEALKIIQDSSKRKSEEKRTVFGIIGLLHPSKGQENAIRAFAKVRQQYPDIELWIAGSGSENYNKYLKDLCFELNVHNSISFLGYVDDCFQFYLKVNVVLVCSEYEGMGRVTAEAMVAGKPVIGLDNAGTSELIDEGKNGLLYDGSVDSLAQRMKYTLENDVSFLAANAREKGLHSFITEDYVYRIKQKLLHVKN